MADKTYKMIPDYIEILCSDWINYELKNAN